MADTHFIKSESQCRQVRHHVVGGCGLRVKSKKFRRHHKNRCSRLQPRLSRERNGNRQRRHGKRENKQSLAAVVPSTPRNTLRNELPSRYLDFVFESNRQLSKVGLRRLQSRVNWKFPFQAFKFNRLVVFRLFAGAFEPHFHSFVYYTEVRLHTSDVDLRLCAILHTRATVLAIDEQAQSVCSSFLPDLRLYPKLALRINNNLSTCRWEGNPQTCTEDRSPCIVHAIGVSRCYVQPMHTPCRVTKP